MKLGWQLLLILGLGLGLTSPGWSHGGPPTYVAVEFDTPSSLRILVSMAPSQRQLLGRTDQEVLDAIEQRWQALDAAEQVCQLHTSAVPTTQQILVAVSCMQAVRQISSRLFPTPGHKLITNILRDNGLWQTVLWSDGMGALQLSSPTGFVAQMQHAMWEGFTHILSGPDHILFVLGLWLVTLNIATLLVAITGFTLAHSLTLLLAASGVLQVNEIAAEVTIAASVALLGWEYWVVLRRQASALWAVMGGLAILVGVLFLSANPSMSPWAFLGLGLFVTGYLYWRPGAGQMGAYALAPIVFGLAHGLGFAGPLTAMAQASPLAVLLGFNLGVEVGQLTVLLLLLLVARLLVRLPALGSHRGRLRDGWAMLLIVAGGYWMLQRLFG